MNLQHVVQHVVQHLLNISLARLHTNKPTGTPGLISTDLYFGHHLCPYDQNQEPKEHDCLHLWTSETLSSYLCQLKLLVLKHASAFIYGCMNIRIIILFLCIGKLEYVNYHFSSEKGGVQINRVQKFYGNLHNILTHSS